MGRSKRLEREIVLRAARVGRVGVVRAPVAKAAVVGAAVASPGVHPVAKTAVVAAAVTPGRRRI
jgi:hypothetical protein